jgi:hypothetical protein
LDWITADPDRAFQQAEAMERVRRRMQEELDAKAARYIEEQKIVSVWIFQQNYQIFLVAFIEMPR